MLDLKNFFYIIPLFVCHFCAAQASAELLQNMDIFEKKNKNSIVYKYKTNTFAVGHSEACEEIMMYQFFFYLLDNQTLKLFGFIQNEKKCKEEYLKTVHKNFFEPLQTWKLYKYPALHVNTLPCQTSKIQHKGFILTIKDNPPISKHFDFYRVDDAGQSKRYFVQEICLSADTLLIGYDALEQPVYLYKY